MSYIFIMSGLYFYGSLDDSEQVLESEELLNIGVESFYEIQKRKNAASETARNNSSVSKQTSRKALVKRGPKIGKSQKTKSVKKTGKHRTEASEEELDSVKNQNKHQKVAVSTANQSFDSAQMNTLSQPFPGTVGENSLTEGVMVLQTAVESEQRKKVIKTKRKPVRPKKESQLGKPCTAATESVPTLVSPLETSPVKNTETKIRTSSTSQLASNKDSKNSNKAAECTVKESMVIENMSTMSPCTDEVSRRMDLELCVEQEEDFVFLDRSSHNSAKVNRKRISDPKNRNPNVRRSVVSLHPANKEVDKLLAGQPEKFPVVVLAKLSGSAFQRLLLEGNNDDISDELTCEGELRSLDLG